MMMVMATMVDDDDDGDNDDGGDDGHDIGDEEDDTCKVNGRFVPGLSPPVNLVSPAVPPMGPGAMPFTRMPYSPHSRARFRVTLSIAALAAQACVWYQVAE
jgi:hypothetical protein